MRIAFYPARPVPFILALLIAIILPERVQTQTRIPDINPAGAVSADKRSAERSGDVSTGEQRALHLLQALQNRYRSFTAFQVDFVQRFQPANLGPSREESGTIQVKMPGRMRWTYEKPEPKVFISDGNRFYFYEPEENAVTIYDGSASDLGSAPILFLTGEGDLTTEFQFSVSNEIAAAEDGNVLILLLPPHEDASFQRAYCEIRPEPRPELRRLVVVDPLDNVTEYRFQRLRENPRLPDELFRFEPPPGTEVWVQGGRSPETGTSN